MIINRFTLPSIALFTRKRVAHWLQRLGKGLESGRFAFCEKGNLVPVCGHAAHMATIFAVKTAYQTGLWHGWSESQKTACICFLTSFQSEDGWVRDPWIAEQYSRNVIASPTLQETIRAETRQLLSLLLTLGEKPPYGVPLEYANTDDMQRFIRSLNWENPWAAASHWAHQAFFVGANRILGKDTSRMENVLFSILDEYYDAATGTWFLQNAQIPELYLRLNGAMKIFSGLAWLSPHKMNHANLIHLCLNSLQVSDSCSFLNQLFVLDNATTVYGDKNLRSIAKKYAIQLIKNSFLFYNLRNGAFSFFHKKSQHNYYGIPVSTGENCPDLHGTAMQTWAIAIALRFIENISGWAVQKI